VKKSIGLRSNVISMVIDLQSEQTDIRISRAVTPVLLLFFIYKSK